MERNIQNKRIFIYTDRCASETVVSVLVLECHEFLQLIAKSNVLNRANDIRITLKTLHDVYWGRNP